MNVELTVGIGLGQEADAAELDEATRDLRRELLDLDVEDVQRPDAGPPPAGARAVEVALLGTLLVSAGQHAVGAVVDVLAGWLSRRPQRSLKLRIGDDEIELTDASDEQQRELVAAFLDRHRTGAA